MSNPMRSSTLLRPFRSPTPFASNKGSNRKRSRLASTSASSMPITRPYDAIVVGLGGVGSFALRSLSLRSPNLRVLGLEQYRLDHELGSSHGESRLFRHAYFEHSDYVPLCLRSTEIFQQLCDWKRQKGQEYGNSGRHIPLLERCGVLMVSDRSEEAGDKQKNSEDSYPFLERCLHSASKYGIPVEFMSSKELHDRYGEMIHISSNMAGLLEPGAGYVRPELARWYALDQAKDNGADILENTEVTRILPSEPDDCLILVETTTGERYFTRSLLVCAGPWASKLLPHLRPHLRVTRQIQAWLSIESPHGYDQGCGWYLDRTNHKLGLYGFPPDSFSENHARCTKVALHGRDVPFDDPDAQRPQVSESELNELRDALRGWIPEPKDGYNFASAKACLYTMSPDEHFIVDKIPGFKGKAFCVAGLSGHGFKMTPALGEAAADLMTKGRTELPVDFLKADRLFT